MAEVERALEIYKRNALNENEFLKRAFGILDCFYAHLQTEKLVALISTNGGNEWLYGVMPLDNHGMYSMSYTISAHRDILIRKLDVQGFEGCELYLDVNSIYILLKVRYNRING